MEEKKNELIERDEMELGLGLNTFTIDPSLLAGSSAAVVEIGTKVRQRFVEKYKGVEGNSDRIAFIAANPIVVKYHYIEGVGYVQCFNGECCEYDSSEPKVRYVFPIIKYVKIDGKKYSEDCKFEIMALCAGADLYDSIIQNHQTLIEEGDEGGITAVDFNVNCIDQNYQKLNLTATKTLVWVKHKKIMEYLKENWEDIVKALPEAQAKSLSPEKFMRLVNEAEDVTDEDEDVVDVTPKKKSAAAFISDDE